MSDIARKNESVERYWLAIAKDIRYVQQCTELLNRILEQPSSRYVPMIAEYVSCILYIVLSTRANSQQRSTVPSAVTTPGMDVCQIQYVRDGIPENTAFWHRLGSILRRTSVATAALLSVTCLYVIRWSSERVQKVRYSSANYNQYKGQQRRNVYHLQRQEMIRRSTNPRTVIPSNTSTTSLQSIQNNVNQITKLAQEKKHWRIRTLQRFNVLCRAVLVSLDKALPSIYSHGPHSATTIPDDESLPTSIDQIRQVWMWIFRFHMAYYCIYGNYPTVFHRFFQYQPQRIQPSDNNRHQSQSLSIMPVVGALVLCRLSYQFLFYAISQPLMRHCVAQLYPLCNHQRHSTTGNTIPVWSGSHASSQNCVEFVGVSPTVRTRVDPRVVQSTACYICQQPPLYPSCSIRCGHVFCWYCIQQWITEHDTKCPICRATCASQDVMYLFNY